jgi:hypothetical protein
MSTRLEHISTKEGGASEQGRGWWALRGRRHACAAVVGAFCALGVAACSSGGGSGPQVASLAGQHSSSSSAAAVGMPSQAEGDRDFVNFAHCLRARGVNEPDPFHRPGHIGLSVEVPPPSPANNAAVAACNHFIAKIIAAKQAGANQELSQWRPHLVQYAQCMRSHDISMLDPGPEGQLNLGNVPGLSSDFGRYSPQFHSADAACRHLLPAGIHDDGTGP